jgi:hypothetical protein
MLDYTLKNALIGGALIGFSSWIFLLFNGRIAGISGITFRALFTDKDKLWAIFFIAGLILGPWLVYPLGFSLPSHISLSWGSCLIGGLLVGFGAKLGSGCTSGHGVCGIGRFSIRSIVATILFILMAIVTVTFRRLVL